MKFNIGLLVISILLQSCYPHSYNAITVIDNSMNPTISWNQMELDDTRGSTGISHYNKLDTQLRVRSCNDSNKGKTVAWLFKNWGVPDRIENAGTVTYYIFDKKSVTAPNFRRQYEEGESPVKIGYKSDRIVYISAFMKNCPKNWQGPNYILPH